MEKRNVDVVIISDVHLGTYGCHAAELVLYLRSIQTGLLIINGDFIDIWNFSKHYFPLSHMAVIKEVMNMMSIGTRVVYITGNHDEMMRRYSGLELGNFQVSDKLVIEINGSMCWIFHGDVFDATTKGSARLLAKLGGKGYDMLILLNRFINWTLAIAGKEKMSFSKKVKNRVKKAVSRISDFEQTAAELAIEKEYDYVICGHIHQPQKRMVQTNKGSVVYLNSGDWVENLSALEYSGREWNIFSFNEKAYEKIQLKPGKPVPDVSTDEVMLYINSLQQDHQ